MCGDGGLCLVDRNGGGEEWLGSGHVFKGQMSVEFAD